MENLKLRVWDSFNEEMVYSSEEHFCLYNKKGKWAVRYSREKTLSNGGIEVDAPVQIESDEIEIMLYAGTDMNGTEVYGGDTMRTEFATALGDVISAIEFNIDKGFILRYRKNSIVDFGLRRQFTELTGNIHQQPELITF